MVTLLLVFSALLGLCVGSFANVLIYRIPNNLSIISPSSHCPKCNSNIPFYQNVPVFSYIFLLGKCSKCKSPISPRYPLVEILVGVLFWFASYNYIVVFPPSFLTIIQLLSLYIFLLFITVLIFIDLEHQILPDVLTIPGTLLGLLSSFIFPFTNPLNSLLGALLGAVVPTILILVYALRKIEAMGWGDVKLMAMVGAYLGWKGALLTFLFGSLLGTFIGGLYILIFAKDRRTPLPFGTFLGIAAIITLFWSDLFWNWYYGFSGGFP